MYRKKIGQSDIIGQQGINIIEEVVLRMGFLWYATGGVEAGIDGIIEIRDFQTGEVTNCILQVQSKATQKTLLQAENENSFEYRFQERDIDYWLQGNAPVILIVVKTSTKEAFWVAVKDYFCDAKRRQSKKVTFDKRFNRFDFNARDALIKLAVPQNSGLYLAPRPKLEKLYSNLLRVSQLAEHLYTAYTFTEDESKAYSALQKVGRNLGQEWLLKENFVLSFHDLRQAPWTEICDLGTVEQHGVDEWSLSNRLELQQEFVWLLNNTLREKIKGELSFDRKKKCYYFKPTNDLSVRQYSYRSLSNALAMYRREHHNLPARVVLHKTSRFIPEEFEGFQDALAKHGIDTAEFISFDNRGGTRLFRYGKYPPLRGTLLSLDNYTQVLYTRGSVDFFSTYPGMYVPRPLKFRCESVEETPKALAQEILALTKMNWNNTQFDRGEPITIRAARQVGHILKYVGKNDPLEFHYRFYM